jgi:DNA ligase-1
MKANLIVEPSRPMLAETCENWNLINFPVLATPKLDGHRCLTLNPEKVGDGKSRCVSRSYKLHRNVFAREWIEEYCDPGLDGELVVLDKDGKLLPFNEISSALSSGDGEPNFRFWIFDDFSKGLSEPYASRMRRLEKRKLPKFCERILPVLIHTVAELEKFEEKCLAEGHEGVMIRNVNGGYKQGRSTVAEGWLLKIKRFKSEEGTVVGWGELFANNNPATVSEVGLTKRSSHSANKVGKGVVGTVIVKPLSLGKPTKEDMKFLKDNAHRLGAAVNDHPYLFNCPISPITQKGNYILMKDAPWLMGKLLTYRHQPSGKLVKPRFPVGHGWRDKRDMDAKGVK